MQLLSKSRQVFGFKVLHFVSIFYAEQLSLSVWGYASLMHVESMKYYVFKEYLFVLMPSFQQCIQS